MRYGPITHELKDRTAHEAGPEWGPHGSLKEHKCFVAGPSLATLFRVRQATLLSRAASPIWGPPEIFFEIIVQ